MTAGDHPEEDSTALLNDEDHTKYHSLIGMLTWSVVIGRFDITLIIYHSQDFPHALTKVISTESCVYFLTSKVHQT